MLTFRLGNIYTKVDKTAPRSELQALHDALSVKVPRHWFSRKFKYGQWDGYKRFFNFLTSTFYSGLLDYAIRQIKPLGIEYRVIDERKTINHHNHPLQLHGITLRPYQVKMIEEAIKSGRGIITAPPNAGKTEVAAGIIKVLGLKSVFFTHRITLLNQTRKRFETRLEREIGLVGGGVEEWSDITIVSVATANSRLNEIKERLEDVPLIFIDECHHASAKTFEKLIKVCKGAHYRYGLSATALLRDDISNMTVRGLLGDEVIAVTNQELITSGISAFPSVFLLNINTPKIPTHFTFDQAYDDGILYNKQRNDLIVKSAVHFLNQEKNVFVLVWRIAHGHILKQMLDSLSIENEFISGEDKAETIEDVLERFSERELKCVVSSTISDEGLDVPSMDVLIMGVGFKAPLKTIQRVGRGLRKKKEGENVVKIVDFVDLHNKKYLYKHSINRLKAYMDMDIPIFEVVDNDWNKEPIGL